LHSWPILNPAETNYWRGVASKVARDYVGKLHFAIADEQEFESELEVIFTLRMYRNAGISVRRVLGGSLASRQSN
jgi:hypothetical protein